MNGFDIIVFAVIWAVPCLICIVAAFAFFNDNTWEPFPLVIMSFFPFINIMAAITIIAHCYDAFKNEKTKAKETIEDKYNRLTKEAYDD